MCIKSVAIQGGHQFVLSHHKKKHSAQAPEAVDQELQRNEERNILQQQTIATALR